MITGIIPYVYLLVIIASNGTVTFQQFEFRQGCESVARVINQSGRATARCIEQ